MRLVNVALSAVLVLSAVTAACGRSTSTPAPAAVSADTWADVNGKAITRSDVEKEFRRASDAPASDEEMLTAKLGILDSLIIEELLVARAGQQNLQVPDAEVDAAVTKAKGGVTDDVFQQQLIQRGLSTADVREGLRRQLLAEKMVDRDVTAKVNVTEQQVTDTFNANRAQFNVPEDAVHLAQIVITPVREPQVGNRTGDDAATPDAATAKVKMLMQRLQEGAPFADLARDYSEDPDSRRRSRTRADIENSAGAASLARRRPAAATRPGARGEPGWSAHDRVRRVA